MSENETPPSDESIEEMIKEGMPVLARGLGKIFLVAGILLTGSEVGWVVYCANTGAEEITVYRKPLGVGLSFFYMGLVLIVGGRHVGRFLDNMNRVSQIKWYEWLVLIAVGAAAWISFEGLMQYFETLGYRAPR